MNQIVDNTLEGLGESTVTEVAGETPMKPNCFVIGAPKCGTTAVCDYLADHPQAFLCYPKEPMFWSDDFPGMRKKVDGIEQYRKLFANASTDHDVIAEGSTLYLHSETAVKSILEFQPNARFIAMLRDPIELVHAWHQEQNFAYIENEPDFERAWELQAARANGEQIPHTCPEPRMLEYENFARLGKAVDRFMQLVPASQRLILTMDDLKSDTRKVWVHVQDFLGLEDDGRTVFPKSNAAKTHRFKWLSNLVLDPPPALQPLVEQTRKALRHSSGPVAWLKRNLTKPQKRAAIRPAFRAHLQELLQEDVDHVASLLDRDLSHWLRNS